MFRLEAPAVGRLLGGWSATQWLLRGGQIASAVVALVAISGAGSVPGFWVVLALAVSGWAFFSPDSTASGVLIVILAAAWWSSVDDPVSGWLLVLAIAVFLIHALTAMAAAGPPTARYGRDVVFRWSRAISAVLGGIVAMWVVLVLLSDAAVPASSWRLVVALIAVALLAAWLRLRSIGDPHDSRLVRRRDLKQ